METASVRPFEVVRDNSSQLRVRRHPFYCWCHCHVVVFYSNFTLFLNSIQSLSATFGGKWDLIRKKNLMKIVLCPHLKPFLKPGLGTLRRFGSWPRFSKKRETQLPARQTEVYRLNRVFAPTLADSLWLSWSHFATFSEPRLDLSCTKGGTSKGQSRHSRKLPKQIIRAVMTGSLSAWREDDFGVTDETSIKNNMFAIITEQEEVKSLTSPRAVQWTVTLKRVHTKLPSQGILTHTHTGKKRLLTSVWCKKWSG